MFAATAKSETVSPVRHFDAKLDGGFKRKPVIGLITLSTDCITEHELHLTAPADKIVISATRIMTHKPPNIGRLFRL
jgi:hypothetical protein